MDTENLARSALQTTFDDATDGYPYFLTSSLTVMAGPLSDVRLISYLTARTGAVCSPVMGDLDAVSLPFRLDGETPEVRSKPPGLGEHTGDVRRELGCPEDYLDGA